MELHHYHSSLWCFATITHPCEWGLECFGLGPPALKSSPVTTQVTPPNLAFLAYSISTSNHQMFINGVTASRSNQEFLAWSLAGCRTIEAPMCNQRPSRHKRKVSDEFTSQPLPAFLGYLEYKNLGHRFFFIHIPHPLCFNLPPCWCCWPINVAPQFLWFLKVMLASRASISLSNFPPYSSHNQKALSKSHSFVNCIAKSAFSLGNQPRFLSLELETAWTFSPPFKISFIQAVLIFFNNLRFELFLIELFKISWDLLFLIAVRF